ncbi:MAG: tripartite tricarboxylate transporter TctB family protein [Trueperaceae bacterium]
MSDRIASGILIIVAVAFIVLAFGIQSSMFTDPLGPRFVPIVIGVFLIGSSITLMLQPRSAATWPDAPTAARLLMTLVVFVVYGFLLNPIGFIAATTFAYTAFALLFRGKPLPALMAGLVFAFASYLLFSTALDLYLPTGRLFEGWF